MSMSQTGDAALRDREERLRSAKKKLKSYRAKQAQLGQARRASKVGSIGSVAESIGSTSFESSLRQSYVSQPSVSIKEKRRSRPLSGVHARSHSRNQSISLRDSTASSAYAARVVDDAPAPNVSRSSAQFVAKLPTSHTRGHSRSGSRSASMSKRGRPASLIDNSFKIDIGAFSDAWADLSEDALHTPTPNTFTDKFLGGADDATPIARTTQASRPLADTSPNCFPSTSSLTSRILTSSASTPPEVGHARRKSRHARKDSVSTRRESMEIMGGLGSMHVAAAFNVGDGFESNVPNFAQRKSRRISSHRWSGLQPASVLFGGSPEIVSGGDKRASGMDWRSAFGALANESEVESRETALDKLEGRFRPAVTQSSVQLPSFDDVHGARGMDKRASQDLLESNLKTTATDRTSLASVPHALPSHPDSASSVALDLGTADTVLGAEGLGTLMEEEEEEEEASSPVRERIELNVQSVDSEARRRTEAENEVVKRTRRTSLQPAPLKLKSRPASLFIAPRPPSSSIPTLGSANSANARQPGFVEQSTDLTQSHDSHDAADVADMTPSEIQRRLAAARLTGALPDLKTPTKSIVTEDMKRAWRASLPASDPSPSSKSATSTSTTPLRLGIRPLRLADNLQHRANAESSSSVASSVSIAPASSTSGHSPLLPRASLVMGSTPNKRSSIGYTNSLREEVSTPTKTSSRRSSIQYRKSNADVAEIDSPERASGDLLFAEPTPAQPSTVSSGVPMAIYDELKSKHQRDITLLDESRKAVSRLESELSSEAERSHREYSELERWSAEEKRTLGQRIEHLEANIVEITEVREAREAHHKRLLKEEQDKQQSLRTQLEDAESERDMLREDVEGWRTRCKDLENSLKNGQTSLSPMLRAISRDGTVSPILDAEAPPPPQAIKLLKDMRQHIMALARQLEEEREEHSRTRQLIQTDTTTTTTTDSIEDSRLNGYGTYDMSSAANSFFTDLSVAQQNDESTFANTTIPSSSSLERLASERPSQNGPRSPSFTNKVLEHRQSPVAAAYKRNHVSAYDSSMESVKRSTSVASNSTQQTSEYHVEGLESPSHGNPKAMNSVTTIDHDHVTADAIGLGVGSLGTLPEEEEATLEHTEASIADLFPLQHSKKQVSSTTSADLESAGRPSDLESVAPPTPALDHYSPHRPAKGLKGSGPQVRPFDESMLSSASTEMEASLPPSSQASQDTIVTPGMDNEAASFAAPGYAQSDDAYDDEEDDLPPPPAPRPEFIREWSFERAASAAQNSPRMRRAKPLLQIGTQGLHAKATPTPHGRKRNNMSIDDFFGIMSIDDERTLPALPTPDEALEMPPVQLISGADPFAAPYGGQVRIPTSAIRPPVAKTSRAYGQPMMTRTVNAQIGRGNNRNYPQRITSQPIAQMTGEQASYAGAGMLSRVVSLTSAFGGYFTGATSASQDAEYDPNGFARDHVDAEAGGAKNDSVRWSVARRVDVEEA